ncbi:hypothetical protein L228DRAFT_270508 [Xylona heveae TC161]|uniref:Uncharacterized protein n=1 Tax=Xylona heveae (strain CBS 132557 / TC161) TaxID=1328760 RepID=A0A165AGJ9_XYLHT|nr:hypothetical protein L228DRAFT_270508 [Xylona heveae TC161]KZF20437.1 hypothetical protein L228DRAFT_270508 [Xylona heveae TC161]
MTKRALSPDDDLPRKLRSIGPYCVQLPTCAYCGFDVENGESIQVCIDEPDRNGIGSVTAAFPFDPASRRESRTFHFDVHRRGQIQVHHCFGDDDDSGYAADVRRPAWYTHPHCYRVVEHLLPKEADAIALARCSAFRYVPSRRFQRERKQYWLAHFGSYFQRNICPALPSELWRMILHYALDSLISQQWAFLSLAASASAPCHPSTLSASNLYFETRMLEGRRYLSNAVSQPPIKHHLGTEFWVGMDARGVRIIQQKFPEVVNDLWWQRLRLEPTHQVKLYWDKLKLRYIRTSDDSPVQAVCWNDPKAADMNIYYISEVFDTPGINGCSDMSISSSARSWMTCMGHIPRMRTLDIGAALCGIAVATTAACTLGIWPVKDESQHSFYEEFEAAMRFQASWTYYRLREAERVSTLWIRTQKIGFEKNFIFGTSEGRILCPSHGLMAHKTYTEIKRSEAGFQIAIDECERYPQSHEIQLFGCHVSPTPLAQIPAVLENYKVKVQLSDILAVETCRYPSKDGKLVGFMVKDRSRGVWTSFGLFRLDGYRETSYVDSKEDTRFLTQVTELVKVPDKVTSDMFLNYAHKLLFVEYWISTK